MSAAKLRAQCLPKNAEGQSTYVRVLSDGKLVGNLFACRWDVVFSGTKGKMCWITQLVVASGHRQQGLASGLLNVLRRTDDLYYGIMSSHPAACLAAAKAFARGGIEHIDVDLLKGAEPLMKESPVEYVREAKLHGDIWEQNVQDGSVALADSGFWVDHVEALDALSDVKEDLSWPLGDLLEGHEFLLVLHHKKRGSSSPRALKKQQT